MKIDESIKIAETRLKKKLEEFFIRHWGQTRLFSHDLEHHRRVWSYAKELLKSFCEKEHCHKSIDSEKLITACLLHDIGMSNDPGPVHGIHSKNLCISFLRENDISEIDYEEVLLALENHDKKVYNNSDESFILFTILSAADDLDAFGYIGIYRYLEIYLARGFNPATVGSMIRNNALIRFRNFESSFGNNTELYNRHRKRYFVLDEFFIKYNKIATSLNYDNNIKPCQENILQIINDLSTGKISLRNPSSWNLFPSSDELVNDFIRGLANELMESFKCNSENNPDYN